MKLCECLSLAILSLAMVAGAGCNKSSNTDSAATNSVAMPSTTNGIVNNNPPTSLTNESTNLPTGANK
ncbi:MAG: hypothetical protein ABSH48_26035 [Verrucomicrobiota bacterium]